VAAARVRDPDADRPRRRLLWLCVFTLPALPRYAAWQGHGATEIEIGADKVRITSSIAGLAELRTSIALLYLFLIEVFRIKRVNMLQQPPAAAQ